MRTELRSLIDLMSYESKSIDLEDIIVIEDASKKENININLELRLAI